MSRKKRESLVPPEADVKVAPANGPRNTRFMRQVVARILSGREIRWRVHDAGKALGVNTAMLRQVMKQSKQRPRKLE